MSTSRQYIAIYALFLAGSNFFAPISAGFITDGQGWQWVLYWRAIFCAIGFAFLLFMEETNYRRPSTTGTESKLQSGTESPVANAEADSTIMDEKTPIDEPGTTDATIDLSYVSCRILLRLLIQLKSSLAQCP
jgi:MFS family permease